ncbi:RraA family protein [Pseudomonas sp. nanlin1]|uniref:RraA family protein n=1 Tax=Pseudomonas sp. nanlin1 TaxID=3040605 RepID=UPI00388E74F5
MSATLAERRQGLDAATLAAFAPVAASTVGHLSERGYLRGVRPLFDDIRLLGNVVTVRLFTPDGSILRQALLACEAGDVLVIECVGDPHCACWGELRTLAGLIKGLAGVVVAGAVTDVQALRGHRLPMFAMGISALTTRSLGLGGELNQPISVAGVQVNPGDLAIGDDDGVYILSAEEARALLPELLAKEQADRQRRDEFVLRAAAAQAARAPLK